MNDPCPHCGLLFQREQGYFLGAMYISYPLSVVLLLPLFIAARVLLPDWSGSMVMWVATAAYLPFIPAVFRYSRVLWIYFDRWGDPYSETLMSAYEKMRLRQLGRHRLEDEQGD